MFRNCCMAALSGLLLIGTLFTFTCTLPLNPMENPDVVQAKIFQLDKEIVEGKEASFGISLTYPIHVCSVVVHFDDNRANDTTVKCQKHDAEPETLKVNFTYPKENPDQIIYVDVLLAKDKVKKIHETFIVRKKNLGVKFVTTPKPHIAAVGDTDKIFFVAKTNTSENDIIFITSSIPTLDDKNFNSKNAKDTAYLVLIPQEAKVYNIACKAKYGDASDSTNVAVTAYVKPLLKSSSGNETQIKETTDTLFLALPSNSSEYQFSLLDSVSYNPNVLTIITDEKGEKTYQFKPNEIKTYSFSFLVTSGELTDTITYYRKVIEKQKPVWNKESENVAAIEGKEITFPFASCLTDPLKEISFTASKGTLVGYSLKYLVPWGSTSIDTITINANNNGFNSPFKLFLNITPSDSIAPRIIRVKPESDTINTDKLTCEFKITDLGAGIGDVKFERDSKVVADTVCKDSIYKCTIGDLKHGDTINIKVTATDKSMKKNSDSMLRKIVVIKSDTAKSFTAFGFSKPLAEGVIDSSTKKILVTVPFGTDVRSLAAAFTITGASVQVASKEQKSDTTVNDFTNPVKYTVVAVDKSTSDYEVTVVVASPGKNADLSGLTVSEGSLNPAFSANITSYTVNVDNSVESLTVTGTLADTNATINYVPSQKVKLSFGDTTITVNVTAQDSTVKKKYEIKVKRAANSNANLLSLTVSQGLLTPAFSSDSTKYTVIVASSVESLTVNGTLADTNATIKYTPSKDVKLSDKENVITVEVTAQDKVTKKKYEIKVIRSVSSSNEITTFGFVEPNVTGIIDSAKKTISVTVPNKTDVKAMVAKFTTTGKTVKVDTKVQISGETINNFKDSVIYTVVAANDSIQNYVVKVTVAQDTSKELTTFGFDSPKVDGKFDKDKKTITVTVPYGTDFKALVARFTTTGKTVKIGDIDQISGTTKNDFSKEVTYKVIADDKSSTEYKVTVKESSPSNNANLSKLTVSSGSLSPVFSENEISYKVNVANNVDKITVTGTKTDPNANIDKPSQEVKLEFGGNIITVEVTAEDGKTKKKYEITVIRAKSSNADLSSLTVSKGELTPAFSKNETSYKVNVANNVDKIILTGTKADPNATIDKSPQEVKLDVGDTIISVVVTAQDGTTKKKYEIKVTRAKSSNADLSSLTVSTGTLTPEFKSNITNYTVTVGNSVGEITVTGKQADPNANIDNASQKVKLEVGVTKNITVEVTAQDGTTKKKYEIKVTRAKSSVKEITSFGFDSPKVDGAIDKDKKTIAVTVPFGTDVKKLVAKFSFNGASVKVSSTVQESGKTENNFSDKVTYTVFAENGEKQDYVVSVSETPPYKYIVTFEAKDATTKPDPQTKEVIQPKTTVEELPTPPKRVSFKFDGWFTEEDGGGSSFTATTIVTKNIKIYAKWVNVYKVTYDGNGHTSGNAPIDNKEYKYGESIITASKGELKCTGHTFKGWCTDKLGNGTIKNENDNIYMGNGDIKLYAIWQKDIYTVTFNADGGTPLPTPQQVSHGVRAVKPADPDKPTENVKFTGWYNGSTLWNFNTEVTSHLTLTAHWEIAYKITYHGNHHNFGDAPVDNKKYINGEKAKIMDGNTLKNTACEFEGWKKIQYGKDEIIHPGQEIAVNGNTTLYAVWVVSDRDGNKYTTVKIGDQLWMIENYRCSQYNNGEKIDMLDTIDDKRGKCKDTKLGSDAGYYYNSYIAREGYRIAPEGWRVASNGDWNKLKAFVNDNAKTIAAKHAWKASETAGEVGNNPQSNNSTGFTAISCGYFDYSQNVVGGVGGRAIWWTSDYDSEEDEGISVYIDYDNRNFSGDQDPGNDGYNIRLIRELQ